VKDLVGGDVGHKYSEMWQALTEEEIQDYEDKKNRMDTTALKDLEPEEKDRVFKSAYDNVLKQMKVSLHRCPLEKSVTRPYRF
jgi:hypothetical protein